MTATPKFSRILVGVDLDESSAQALQAASALATAFDGAITAVHVHTIERPAYFTDAQMGAIEAESAVAKARCTADIAAFASTHSAAPVTVLVEEGAPADTLCRLAASFDVVVLGTHRRRAPQRWWIGSVAEAVLRESPVPVLVVPLERKEP